MKIFPLFFLFFSASAVQAQTFNSPESVEKNLPEGSYFVSNNGTGEILKLWPDGTLQLFASGFSSGPHGLELVGDTLYVCDGASVALVNRITGAIIQHVNLGASFLNGITHKGKDLYITDFSAKKIYRFNTSTNSFNIFVNAFPKTPNGIVYDDLNDRLVLVCWGASAPVYEINLYDSTYQLLTTTSVGNIDGITMNCQGDFYISCWSPNSIRKYSADFTSSSVMATSGITGPADIYFDPDKDTLYVPNSGTANNVVKLHAPSCLTAGTTREFDNGPGIHVFPNPSEGVLHFTGVTHKSRVVITDLSGRQIMVNHLNPGSVSLDFSFLVSGIYLLYITSENGFQTIKIHKK